MKRIIDKHSILGVKKTDILLYGKNHTVLLSDWMPDEVEFVPEYSNSSYLPSGRFCNAAGQ